MPARHQTRSNGSFAILKYIARVDLDQDIEDGAWEGLVLGESMIARFPTRIAPPQEPGVFRAFE